MNYRNKYQREPYVELKDSWYEYEKSLRSIEKKLLETKFNFFEQNNTKLKEPPFGVKFIEADKFELQENLYLLPSSAKKYSIEEMVEIPNLPKEINLPKQPQLHLQHSDYPPDYFRTKTGFNPAFLKLTKEIFDSFLGNEVSKDYEKNKFQIEIDERKEIIQFAENLKEKINQKFQQLENEKQKSIEYIKKLSESTSEKDVIEFLQIVNFKHELSTIFRNEIVFQLFKESQTLVVQFKFPDLTNKKIVLGFLKSYKPKLANETLRKKLIKQCLYSMMIRIGHLSAVFNINDLYKSVVINVEQDWFDPATGQQRNGVIATLQAPTEYLLSLNLSQLDPEACFKHLKGISVPSYDNINPVRPIFELNKEDDRFVESKNVSIDEEANLAAMPWEDFEHLVAQLFEWEFARSGVEVRVTRASRDRGVDAILFDPDPLRGGKFVLQAKRYTRTVDVSAVRDLYGTVMNEGANRGILIATSSYGPDSYEFAKDKPISLVDGPNLLLMLQKHGKKFKIDLEEARRLNEENKN
jgi:restriction system protein